MTLQSLHKTITDENLLSQSISRKYQVFNKSTPLTVTIF